MNQKPYQKTVSTFQSGNHALDIVSYLYVPAGVNKANPPLAVVQVIHGMCEYIERYEPFAAFLAQHRIVLCGADHIGHGASVSHKYELGYFGEKGGSELLAADAYRLTKKMMRLYPDVPYFYLGHSMGSFVLRDLLARFRPAVAGAVICGTAGPAQPFGLGLAFIRLVRRLKGSHYRSAAVDKLMFGSYNKRIAHPKTAHDWISRDEAVVAAYNADEKCTFTFTNAAMEDLVRLLRRVSRKDWAGRVNPDTPLYLIAGDADPVGSYGKGVTEVYERLKAAGIKDLSIKLYPNARHELLNETNRDEVMQDVLVWIKARIPEKKA